jgi:hypothetical protein
VKVALMKKRRPKSDEMVLQACVGSEGANGLEA